MVDALHHKYALFNFRNTQAFCVLLPLSEEAHYDLQ